MACPLLQGVIDEEPSSAMDPSVPKLFTMTQNCQPSRQNQGPPGTVVGNQACTAKVVPVGAAAEAKCGEETEQILGF